MVTFDAMDASDTNPPERLVAEDVHEAVWLRLRRFTSYQLCRRLIGTRAPNLPVETADLKASGMSWAVRSALGYWDTDSRALNSRVLSRYYALLHISIAEQIASRDPEDNLQSIQRHTEYGHGLFTFPSSAPEFPANYLVGCLTSGHFPAYCKNLKLDLSQYVAERRPRKETDPGLSKAISLRDLICRVPELQTVVTEYLGVRPQSFHIAYASRNHSERSKRMRTHGEKTGEVLFDPPQEGSTITTYVGIHPHGYEISADELNGLGLPIRNIVEETEGLKKQRYFVGEFTHPKEGVWWNYIQTYKSGYCGTSIVLPFWGTNDLFLLHLVILYAFSIIVRYLPDLWHEIEDGRYDHIRALLEHYLVIVDNVLPAIAVERLTGTRLLVMQPGSLSAPV